MATLKPDTAATWANSAAAGTEVNIDLDSRPDPTTDRGAVIVDIHNPSTVTALTGKPKAKQTLNATARHATLDGASFNVPANSTRRFLIDPAWLVGEAARLTLSNDTALGAADGFSARVKVTRA